MPSAGLLDLIPELCRDKPAVGVLASGAVVFGVQRLVPTYDRAWYMALEKPKWNPPNWVFPAVWIPLKVMQTVAMYLVCRDAPSGSSLALPLAAFGTHLFLGNWWNVVFFGRHQLQGSLPWMATFWASIAGTIASFHPVSKLAAMLMVPTQIWVTIAAKLNWDIVKLNKGKAKQ